MGVEQCCPLFVYKDTIGRIVLFAGIFSGKG